MGPKAHRLGKGRVTPKRVQSKGFGCESCYLHSPSQPSCLKLHRLLIWQSRHQNTTNRRKRERPKSSLASTTLVREQFIVQLNWFCICQQINTKDIICQQYMGYIKGVQNRVCSRICLAYFLGHILSDIQPVVLCTFPHPLIPLFGEPGAINSSSHLFICIQSYIHLPLTCACRLLSSPLDWISCQLRAFSSFLSCIAAFHLERKCTSKACCRDIRGYLQKACAGGSIKTKMNRLDDFSWSFQYPSSTCLLSERISQTYLGCSQCPSELSNL